MMRTQRERGIIYFRRLLLFEGLEKEWSEKLSQESTSAYFTWFDVTINQTLILLEARSSSKHYFYFLLTSGGNDSVLVVDK